MVNAHCICLWQVAVSRCDGGSYVGVAVNVARTGCGSDRRGYSTMLAQALTLNSCACTRKRRYTGMGLQWWKQALKD